MIEVKDNGVVLARYIPASSAWENGLSFFSDDEDCAFDILHSRAWAPGKKSSFVIIDTYASRRGGVSMLFLFLLFLLLLLRRRSAQTS